MADEFEPDIIDRPIELRGANRWLYEHALNYEGEPRVEEFVLEGPAGTGKSITDMALIYSGMELFPGIRILVVRQTRKALSESFCTVFEQDICTGDEPWMGPKPETRVRYMHENGSQCVLFGLDTPEHGYSTQYDWIFVQEAFQIQDEGTVDKFYRMLRRFHHPLAMLVLETNPRHKYTWLWRRMERGRAKRLQTFLRDNPKYFLLDGTPKPEGVAYVAGLKQMLGNNFLWLYKGEWTSAEGLIYSHWDEVRNFVDAPAIDEKTKRVNWKALGISYFVVGVDWGGNDPACVAVYGVAESGSSGVPNAMFRAAEWMTTIAGIGGAPIMEWICERVCEAYFEFQPCRRVVCDPQGTASIQMLNVKLGSVGVVGSRRDEVPTFAIAADNSLTRSRAGDLSGIDLMRQLIGDRVDNTRFYIVRGSQRFIDQTLKSRGRPTCLEEEIFGYVYEQPQEGKMLPPGAVERPSKACDGRDNALDVARYVANFTFGRNLHAEEEQPRYKPGTLAYAFRDWEVDGPLDEVERERQKKLKDWGE